MSDGPIMCAGHARQVSQGREPDMPCEPFPTWTGGREQVVTCDVLNDPAKVEEYRASVAEGLARPFTHGTTGGYQQHRKRGEDACPDCKNAVRRANEAHAARKIASSSQQ